MKDAGPGVPVTRNARVSVQANAPQARYAGAKTSINELLRGD